MHIRNYLEPSARDFKIYWAHMSDNIAQKKLAKKYKISAPRVSQIVKKTRAWIANKLPGKRESHSREQDGFVACYTRLHEVRKHYKSAYRTHQRQFQPTPDGKSPRPDPRWLKLADDMSQRKAEVEDRLTLARNVAEDHLKKDGCYEEDQAVETAREDIRIVKEAAEGMMRAGLCAPFDLPPIDDAEVERTARDAIRRKNPGRRLQHQANLSSAWQAVVEQVYARPLGGLCAEGQVQPETVEIPRKTGGNEGALKAYVTLPTQPCVDSEEVYFAPAPIRHGGDSDSIGHDHANLPAGDADATFAERKATLAERKATLDAGSIGHDHAHLPAGDADATFAERKATLDAGSIGHDHAHLPAGDASATFAERKATLAERKAMTLTEKRKAARALRPRLTAAQVRALSPRERLAYYSSPPLPPPPEGTPAWEMWLEEQARRAETRAEAAGEREARRQKWLARDPSKVIRWEPSTWQ